VPGVIPLRDRNPTRRMPIVTIALLILNIYVFFVVQEGDGSDPAFTFEYAAIPEEVTSGEPLDCGEIVDTAGGVPASCQTRDDIGFEEKSVWLAVIYSMFFHGSLVHIGFNMLFLWVFGNNIEDRLGHVPYLLFYVASGIVATLAHVAVDPGSTIPLVGASGAIAGVMGAYLVWFPNVRILTAFFFILILLREIRAKWLLGIWFVLQFFTNPNEGVAWMAHVGGFVFGVLVALVVRGAQPARVERPGGYDARW
jgi:membrane associated rhomboid family serine protease